MRQLTALDQQFLALEDSRNYGHVGALSIYDPSTAPGGQLTLPRLQSLIAERLPLVPPFRWRLAESPIVVRNKTVISDFVVIRVGIAGN